MIIIKTAFLKMGLYKHTTGTTNLVKIPYSLNCDSIMYVIFWILVCLLLVSKNNYRTDLAENGLSLFVFFFNPDYLHFLWYNKKHKTIKNL